MGVASSKKKEGTQKEPIFERRSLEREANPKARFHASNQRSDVTCPRPHGARGGRGNQIPGQFLPLWVGKGSRAHCTAPTPTPVKQGGARLGAQERWEEIGVSI